MACCGQPIRQLSGELPGDIQLPAPFSRIKVLDKGILVIEGNKFDNYNKAQTEFEILSSHLSHFNLAGFPLIVVVDDAGFTCEKYENFLWVTFTRSNPSHDIYGIGSFDENKHWGCNGSLIIDARVKPHHAPVLEVDKKTKDKVDRLFGKNGSLATLKI